MLVAGGFIGLEVGLKFALRLGARQKHAIGLTIHRYRLGRALSRLNWEQQVACPSSFVFVCIFGMGKILLPLTM
jgi:hypothetical protein